MWESEMVCSQLGHKEKFISLISQIRQLQMWNKRLKETIQAALRIKKLWLPEGVWGASTQDEQAALVEMHTMFKQALKGECGIDCDESMDWKRFPHCEHY